MISYEQAIGIKQGYFEGDAEDYENAIEFLGYSPKDVCELIHIILNGEA